jgi:nitronate monooxygenase
MGVGVSSWRLARAVAIAGQMGVVSGTAPDALLARRLQLGDQGGELRRALAAFPAQQAAERVLSRYFVPSGKAASAPFKSKPMPSEAPSTIATELTVMGAFVEVFLAREGHEQGIGINLLEKIQTPTLAVLYGAMLAGVSCVLMGAGIPRAIPGVLDALARNEAVELTLDVQGATPGERFVTRFDPAAFWHTAGVQSVPRVERPRFYAVVSSETLASVLAKKASGRVDGFVIEGPSAGGHNAPPRGPLRLNGTGEPIYGERDVPNLEAIRALGVPFWLAGSYATPERMHEALAAGAAGVQVGTAFAYCEESGLDAGIKRRVLEVSRRGEARVHSDPRASPTGFPLKVLTLPGTRGAPESKGRTARMCDLGYLRQAYRRPDGKIGWRCPAEPVSDYIAKGGTEAETKGRMCVCNGLIAAIGLGQVREGVHEMPLVTSGDDVQTVARFLNPGECSYSARQVIDRILAGAPAGTGSELA